MTRRAHHPAQIPSGWQLLAVRGIRGKVGDQPMSDTDPIIAFICDADLTRRNVLAGFVRESFTTLETAQLYVAHRAQEKEKTAQQAAK